MGTQTAGSDLTGQRRKAKRKRRGREDPDYRRNRHRNRNAFSDEGENSAQESSGDDASEIEASNHNSPSTDYKHFEEFVSHDVYVNRTFLLVSKLLQLNAISRGDFQEIILFMCNLCALSRFLLNKAPDLLPEAEKYVGKDLEFGRHVLNYVLKGPHNNMMRLCKQDGHGEGSDANKKRPSYNQIALASNERQSAPTQPPKVINCEAVEGSTNSSKPSLEALQTQTAQGLSRQMSDLPRPQTQGGIGLYVPSVNQQGSQSVSAASFQAYQPSVLSGQQPPLPPAAAPESGNNPQMLQAAPAVSSVALPTVPNGHVANPGLPPAMPQYYLPACAAQQQQQSAPINIPQMQVQVTGAQDSVSLHSHQPTGLGWAGGVVPQPPTQVNPTQPTSAVPTASGQVTMAPPIQQWIANLNGLAPPTNQAAPSTQRGPLTTQPGFQPQGTIQPGQLHTSAQQSSGVSQAESLANPLSNTSWLGQLPFAQAESMTDNNENFLTMLANLPHTAFQ
ncbi:hypothetical protein BDV41DRAFT_356353 [Aspergillus transmontanensis]|uniref:Uncharacterized protein n=1 Tax=Aspergillus transmontanensis TaxID=1034304 RepID=A0A5N6VR65_9EURO|nr:hypothetical protein BDV41DRAFT_356353 [Aspergillus transmontanensis]